MPWRRQSRRCARAWLPASLTVLLASAAHAQPATAPGAPDKCADLRALHKSRTDAAALFELGDCYEQQGKIASAWVTMREAATVAKTEGATQSEADARARAARLEETLPRVLVSVPSPEPGLEVLRNGAPIGEELYGVAFPIDPGSVDFEARAPGKLPWKTTLVVPAAKVSLSVVVPRLAAGGPAARAPIAPAIDADGAEEETSGPGAQRIVAATTGAVGLAGIAVGAIFGLRTMSLWDDAKAECPAGDNRCTPKGIELGADAELSGNISTIAFAAGGALLIGGTVLWLTSPSAPARVAVTTSGTSVSVRGAF